MTSYDVGYLFGYMLALKWVNKNLALPDSGAVKDCAREAYRKHRMMFQVINKQDFYDGFTDGELAAYKGEKLIAA